MWLSSGDFTVPIPGGIPGIIIAAIFATAVVLVAVLKRRPVGPARPESVRDSARPAIGAAADAAADAIARQYVQALERIAALEAELDEAYQSGFRPSRPRQRPRGSEQA